MTGLGLLWRVARGSLVLSRTEQRSCRNEQTLHELRAELDALEKRCGKNFHELGSQWIALKTAVNCVEKHIGRDTTEWKCNASGSDS